MDFTKFSGEELKSMLRNHTFTAEDLECAAHLVDYKGNARQLFEDAMQTDFGSTKISNLMNKGRRNNYTVRQNNIMVGGMNNNNTRRRRMNERRRFAQLPNHRRRILQDDDKMMKLFFLIVLVVAAFAKAFGRM